MADLTRDQLIDLIDQLAREWDACEYEAPGGTIDIGEAIRTAGYLRTHRLFDAPGVSPAPARYVEVGAVLIELDETCEQGKTAKPYITCMETLDLPPGRHPIYVASGVAPAAPVFDFNALERAMELASLMAGSVGMNDTKGSAGYRNDLRAHLSQFIAHGVKTPEGSQP